MCEIHPGRLLEHGAVRDVTQRPVKRIATTPLHTAVVRGGGAAFPGFAEDSGDPGVISAYTELRGAFSVICQPTGLYLCACHTFLTTGFKDQDRESVFQV